MKTHLLSFSLPLRLTAVLASMFASALFAQTQKPAPVRDANTVKHADASFLKKAAQDGNEEINVSTVAISRSTNAQIKDLAQMIVGDHQRIGTELAALAARRGVELPAKDMGANKWEKKNAKGFDKDYLKEMVSHHEDAVEHFAKAAKSDDAEIASFASKQLPMLQAHLTKAKELLRMLK